MRDTIWAFRQGRPGPPSLSKFELERWLWRELGQSLSEFLARPWREVDRYLLFIEVENREKAIAREQANTQQQSS